MLATCLYRSCFTSLEISTLLEKNSYSYLFLFLSFFYTFQLHTRKKQRHSTKVSFFPFSYSLMKSNSERANASMWAAATSFFWIFMEITWDCKFILSFINKFYSITICSFYFLFTQKKKNEEKNCDDTCKS